MMTSSNYRAKARAKLAGNWKKAVLITLAYFAISFVLNFIEGLCSEGLKSIVSLIIAIIEVPLSFGLIIAFFKFFNDEEVKPFDFLSLSFSNFKKAWGISIRISLKLIIPIILIFLGIVILSFSIASLAFSFIAGSSSGSLSIVSILGFLLFIIGLIWGLCQSYYYQLAYIVAVDNETLTNKEVVEKCKEIMQDKRWKLFCLQFSFIGWMILSSLTFGIGMLWLLPYMQGSMIEFAKDALGNNYANTDVDEDVNPIQ